MIFSMQLKPNIWKWCHLLIITINDREEEEEDKEASHDNHPILWKCIDLFSPKLHFMPPLRAMYFQIDLVCGVILVLREPYRMITNEINEHKI